MAHTATVHRIHEDVVIRQDPAEIATHMILDACATLSGQITMADNPRRLAQLDQMLAHAEGVITAIHDRVARKRNQL